MGQYNRKWPINLVYVWKPLIILTTAGTNDQNASDFACVACDSACVSSRHHHHYRRQHRDDHYRCRRRRNFHRRLHRHHFDHPRHHRYNRRAQNLWRTKTYENICLRELKSNANNFREIMSLEISRERWGRPLFLFFCTKLVRLFFYIKTA